MRYEPSIHKNKLLRDLANTPLVGLCAADVYGYTNVATIFRLVNWLDKLL